MILGTDSSSALLPASNQRSDANQRRFTREQDNGLSTDQDTVTLSSQIMVRLYGDTGSEERIAALKQQYENGMYQPNWQELAGRILDIHL